MYICGKGTNKRAENQNFLDFSLARVRSSFTKKYCNTPFFFLLRFGTYGNNNYICSTELTKNTILTFKTITDYEETIDDTRNGL